MCESFDESSSFLLFVGQFFDFLLIGRLVVVEAIFDGKNVLVDGNAVSEELNNAGCTF